jgi:phosphoglycolate phosphatase-like HAD superfamily hydrolase
MRSEEHSILRVRMMSLVLALLLVGVAFTAQATAAEPLPAWHDSPARSAILEFVERTTTPGSPDFLEPAARIAVFDNDGTLWPETPLPFQAQFVLDELERLQGDHPEWKENPAIMAALAGDLASVLRSGSGQGAMLLEATHAGMTVDDFNDRVRRWLDTARHPVYGRPYSDLAYQPMLEVLDLLRDHGFTPFIVSGGGADFMRVWAEEVYGIPPSQVIGSYGKVRYELRDDRPVLVKEGGIELIDDREGKPVGIHRFIGRRPVACFGNSDGDQAMLEWTTIGHPPSFGLIVHHTDAVRESAYDADPKGTGKLVTALEAAPRRGWVVVDMARDWKVVFKPLEGAPQR